MLIFYLNGKQIFTDQRREEINIKTMNVWQTANNGILKRWLLKREGEKDRKGKKRNRKVERKEEGRKRRKKE